MELFNRPLVPRSLFVWAPIVGWLIVAGGWAVWADDPCSGCGGGPILQAAAPVPFLMALFIFPYNLLLPLISRVESQTLGFGLVLAVCVVIALVLHRILPPKCSALQAGAVVAVWIGASLGALQLLLSGSGLP